jgi:hypothetical protein
VQLAYNGTFNFSAWDKPGYTDQFDHVAMSEDGTFIYLFKTNYFYKSIDSGRNFYRYYVHEGSLEGGVCSANGQHLVYVGNYANTGLAYAEYSSDYGATWTESPDSWIASNCMGANNYGLVSIYSLSV